MSKRFDWDARNGNGTELDIYALWQAALRQKWRLVTPAFLVLVLLGVWSVLMPPSYTAVARITRVSPSIESPLDTHSVPLPDAGTIQDQISLLSSEEFARRALAELRDNADLPTGMELAGMNLLSDETGRAIRPILRHIGFKSALAGEMASVDQLLVWLRQGLTIKADEETGELSIVFKAKDATLAAKIANKYAELYLDLQPSANSVAAAVAARQTAFPYPSLMVLGPLATLMIGFACLFTREYRTGRLLPGNGIPQQPRVLGEIKLFARFDETFTAKDRSSLSSGVLLPLPSSHVDEAADAADIAARIRRNRRDGLAAHIVVAGVDLAGKGARPVIGLGRQLAQEGRTILIDLGGVWQKDPSSSGERGDQPGLAEVLDGQASFAQAIRRDPASRLHVLATEPERSFDLRAFDVVFEALSQTYDFILLTAPPLDQSPVASKLAARADLVILTTLGHHEHMIESAHAELRRNSDCEVLVIGVGGRLMPRLVENAA